MDAVGLGAWCEAAQHRRGPEHAEGAAVLRQAKGKSSSIHCPSLWLAIAESFSYQYIGSSVFLSFGVIGSNTVFMHVIRVVRRSRYQPPTPHCDRDHLVGIRRSMRAEPLTGLTYLK